MIDTERLRRTFLDLVAIDSPPGREREVSRYCIDALEEAGFVCQCDAAGNVIAQRGGAAVGGRRIFFSAHTDTVQPTEGLVVREESLPGNDVLFRTSGNTILGADDKAAVAALLEAARVLHERGLPHGDLQIVLTTREEVGLQGAKALATEVIAGSLGFVFDASGSTGAIVTAAPTHEVLEVRIRGRAAHAGFAPERGISALQIACRAVDRMPLGRIDPETTANLGILRGGTATNIVPEEAYLRFEARSRNFARLEAQVRAMRECLEEAAAHFGGEVEIRQQRDYTGYCWTPEDLPVRLAAEAWSRTPAGSRRPAEFRATGGGSDANVFNARGVPSVVLSCGYLDAHTVEERVALSDLVAAAQWALAVAEVAAEEPGPSIRSG